MCRYIFNIALNRGYDPRRKIMSNCTNLNHNKMNVAVRFCSACGEVVNQKIKKQTCSSSIHGQRRKDRSAFCTDCGEKLS